MTSELYHLQALTVTALSNVHTHTHDLTHHGLCSSHFVPHVHFAKVADIPAWLCWPLNVWCVETSWALSSAVPLSICTGCQLMLEMGCWRERRRNLSSCTHTYCTVRTHLQVRRQEYTGDEVHLCMQTCMYLKTTCRSAPHTSRLFDYINLVLYAQSLVMASGCAVSCYSQ